MTYFWGLQNYNMTYFIKVLANFLVIMWFIFLSFSFWFVFIFVNFLTKVWKVWEVFCFVIRYYRINNTYRENHVLLNSVQGFIEIEA